MSRAHAAYLAAPGDWPVYLFDNERSGFNGNETSINPTTAPHLKLHWAHRAGGVISTQPVEANNLIYWGSWDGFEHATNLTGTDIWATNLGTSAIPYCSSADGVASTAMIASVAINGKPTVEDFVGGGNGQFYALNASTGAIIWHTLLGSSPTHFLWSSPLLYNGSIYEGLASIGDCPNVQGQLIQMDASTGLVQHVFNVVPNGCRGGGVWGSPTIDEVTSMIYFATGNAGYCVTSEPYTVAIIEARASDLSLVSSWQVPLNQQINDSDFGSTPTLFSAAINGVSHNLVGLENKNGEYFAFDRADIGKGPIWRATIAVPGGSPLKGGSISPSAWDGSTLYVAGGETTINGSRCQGSLRALNPSTGAFIWQLCLLDGPVLGAVTAVPGVVVVGQGSNLTVVAVSSGKILYSYQSLLGGPFYGAASISKGMLYIGCHNGYLYAFGL